MNNSLIFIPDISGFTKFTVNVELEHSAHIVSELLKEILDANVIGLEALEIEGDAIQFVKYNDVPPLEDILRQAKVMYLRFHQHLAKYNSQRVCHCGACRSAKDLSLKFFSHNGPLQTIEINGTSKAHGPAMITAHRLMKNDVPIDEYLLATDSFEGSLDITLNPKDLTAEYETIGKVNYSYVNMEPYMKDIHEDPLPTVNLNNFKFEIHDELEIDCPPKPIYDLVSSLDRRSEINPKIKILKVSDELNRVGSSHRCLVNGDEFEIETIVGEEKNGIYRYGERNPGFKFISELASIFEVKELSEGKSSLSTTTYVNTRGFLGRLLGGVAAKQITKSQKTLLANVKGIIESEKKQEVG